MRDWLRLLLSGVVLSCMLSVATAAQADVYTRRWNVVRSEHFTLYYHRELEPIATDVLSMCEQAHALLVGSLAESPPRRTHVVLVDTFDAANGSASTVPRNTMQLLVMAPESDSVLGHYENWMWNLIVHEYTHILHIDSMGRGYRALNTPFGKRHAPNQLLPRWFIEGLATWQESVRSGRGRIESARFRGILDAIAVEGAIPEIGSLSGVLHDWPAGSGWYLFGGFFVDWIARTRGAETLGDYIAAYGRRAIPLGVNLTARNTLGATFSELWDEWREVARTEALARLERHEWLTPWEYLTTRGHESDRVVGDGHQVAWMVDDGQSRRRIEVRGQGKEWAVDVDENGTFALFGDDHLIVSEARLAGRAASFRDLHAVDSGGRFERLTRRARAREPAVSPDGRFVAYVRPEAGRTDLMLLDLERDEERVLLEAARWGQISTPRFSPDGRALVFSYLVPGQGRDVHVFDLETESLEALWRSSAMEIDPVYSPDGRCVIYSSDRDGGHDLYAFDLETRLERRLTRTRFGAFQPAPYERDGRRWIYAAVLGRNGYNVARVEIDSWCAGETVDAPEPVAEALLPSLGETSDSSRYRDVASFVPLRWTPSVAAAGSDVVFGVQLGGGDPMGLWTWDTTALWTTQLDTWSAAAGVGTRRLPLDAYIYSVSQAYARTQSLIAESRYVPYIERNTLFTPSLSLPFDGRVLSRSISGSYTFQQVSYEQVPEFRHRPWDIEPVMPLIGRLDGWSVNLNIGETDRYADSISTESGWALGTGVRFRRRFLGSLTDATEVSGSLRGYVPLWGRWVVAGRFATGWNAEGRGAGRYGIGGPSGQDVLVALRLNSPAGTAHVRGYAPQQQSGRSYGLLNAELRFPLVDFDWGPGVFPMQFSQLSGAVFVDSGSAFDLLEDIDALVGVGAEVRVDGTLGYFRGAAFRAGFARGLSDGGQWDVYALYGWQF